MFYTVIQYIFIAAVFIIAVGYVIKMFKDSLASKKSCAKGCGCDDTSGIKKESEIYKDSN